MKAGPRFLFGILRRERLTGTGIPAPTLRKVREGWGTLGVGRAGEIKSLGHPPVGHGLKRNGSGVLRNRNARVMTAILEKRARNLERFGEVMKTAGHIMAAYESVENFRKCEGER